LIAIASASLLRAYAGYIVLDAAVVAIYGFLAFL
jgi:hypothetical protein